MALTNGTPARIPCVLRVTRAQPNHPVKLKRGREGGETHGSLAVQRRLLTLLADHKAAVVHRGRILCEPFRDHSLPAWRQEVSMLPESRGCAAACVARHGDELS